MEVRLVVHSESGSGTPAPGILTILTLWITTFVNIYGSVTVQCECVNVNLRSICLFIELQDALQAEPGSHQNIKLIPT